MDQEEGRICASHRSWYCWRTMPLLRHRGRDFDVFGTTDDADLGAWLAHFMEEGDRR
jgi:hypothetical protein